MKFHADDSKAEARNKMFYDDIDATELSDTNSEDTICEAECQSFYYENSDVADDASKIVNIDNYFAKVLVECGEKCKNISGKSTTDASRRPGLACCATGLCWSKARLIVDSDSLDLSIRGEELCYNEAACSADQLS